MFNVLITQYSASKKMADLGFFASADTSSSEDEEESPQPNAREDKGEDTKKVDDPNKLPSPHTLFQTVGKPDFLTTPDYFDWDRHAKSFDEREDTEDVHTRGNYAAIPPPPGGISSGEAGGQGVSRPPVRYDRQHGEADRVSSSIEAGLGMKRQRENDGSVTVEAGQGEKALLNKKKKGEVFRDKEKRKRDLGMTSRGKSYVEEEKRVLRQAFNTDQIM